MTDATRLRWPTGTDYSQAVQSPAHAFAAGELTATQPVISAMGVPMAATGQNAVVFLLRDVMQRSFALRCFTTPSADGAARYHALAAHLETLPRRTSLAPATWIEQGVMVGDRHWPVVLMPWVSGKPMNLAVEDFIEDGHAAKLTLLADNWMHAVNQLQMARIAHGDLQHGNVLVAEDGQMTLVDLDGVWVPNQSLPPPNEVGHPNYQHPGREGRHWGQHVDSFSAVLVDTSLRALAADPSLAEFMGGESLVVARPDLVDPANSEAWRRLAMSPDPNVRTKVATLRQLLSLPFEQSLRPISELTNGSVAISMPGAAAALPPLTPMLATTTIATGNWWDAAPAPDLTVARPAPPAPHAPPAPAFADAAGRPGVTSMATAPTFFQPGQPARPGAPMPGPTATHLTVAADRRWMIGKSPEVAGAIGGLIAGLVSCLLYGSLKMSVSSFYRPALFLGIVASLIGGFVRGWQPMVAGQYRTALKRCIVGLEVGALAGVVSLAPADIVMKALLDLPARGFTTDASALPIALVWAIVAALVGAAVGTLQNQRAAMFGSVAGGAAGLVGGFYYGVTVATFRGPRLLILQWEPATIFAIALVTTMIGVAIGGANKRAAVGTLTVIEGDRKGLEVLVKHRSSIGSSALVNALTLSGANVLSMHAQLSINNGTCAITAHGPIRINGAEHRSGTTTMKSGDVIMIGTSYVRLKLRTETESGS